ncbi:MAG: ABC transporter permease, partial [Anaerolineales bacterium]|nr:ABC transporter permease [Anaerolineales bacterium]
ARNLSIMVGMTMGMLGGCWWPLELFPEWMRTAVHIFPTTWAMNGLMDLLIRNAGVADVALNTAVLLGYALVFGLIGVWRMRFE